MVTSSLKDSSLTTKLLAGIILILVLAVLWLFSQLVRGVPLAADTSSLIVRQVKDVSELTTALFEMDAVVPVSDKGFLGESKLLYIAHGNVRVGIDLSEFHADDVQVEGKKIVVTLPPLKILGSTLDLDHSSVYSYDGSFLSRQGNEAVKLQSQAQREALKKVEAAACRNWLMQTAGDRVQKTVEQMLSQVLMDRGYTEIIVKAQLPSEGNCSSHPANSTISTDG
ncbi:DUF4230 domain-containing protein [Leptolyngbyaceae cyanobacterium UHCC 1019]